MKRILSIIFILIAAISPVFSYNEEELFGTWEVRSFMSDMIRTFYTFQEGEKGFLKIVITSPEQVSFHSFLYEIKEDILFVTLIDEDSGEILIDSQSGKTKMDKYRIVFIGEKEALLQTADRDVVLVKQSLE